MRVELILSLFVEELHLLDTLIIVTLLRQDLPELVAVTIEISTLLCELTLD